MIRISILVSMSALLGLLGSGCSKDATPPRLSNQGEACRATSDCAGALLCIGQTCTSGDVAVDPEAKQCSLIACTTAANCCTPQMTTAQCAQYDTDCLADATSTACTYYQNYCCPASVVDALYACNNGLCQSKCATDTDCLTSGLTHCSAGSCVRCLQDSDCPTNNTCAANACVAACTSDGQCPAMQRCQSNHCEFVGCSNDRECVAYTLSASSHCDATSHRCSTPCTNDAECLKNSVVQTGLNYAYQVCMNGSCQNAGCQSDDECKDLLHTQITATRMAVCTTVTN